MSFFLSFSTEANRPNSHMYVPSRNEVKDEGVASKL